MERLRGSITGIAVAILLGACVSGCTGEDEPPPPPADRTRSQVEEGLADLWAGDNPTNESMADAECFAAEFASRTDRDELQAAGLITADKAVVAALPVLDESLARTWVDAQFECVDYVEESTRALAVQSRGDLDQEIYTTCLAEEIEEAAIREALVEGLSGEVDSAALDRLAQAQLTCVEESS